MKVRTSNILFGVIMVAIIAISILTTSCAQFKQRVAADGGLIGTYQGAWVVIKQSGGVITDVYLLDDALVKSEQGSDGWLFLDQNGNPVHLGGDMKAIRCNNDKQQVFSQYVEYHMDIDRCSYKEKYESVKNKIGMTTPDMDIKYPPVKRE